MSLKHKGYVVQPKNNSSEYEVRYGKYLVISMPTEEDCIAWIDKYGKKKTKRIANKDYR